MKTTEPYELRQCIGHNVVEVYYSPDDNGFYSMVWDRVSGKDIHQTELTDTAQKALKDAKKYLRNT